MGNCIGWKFNFGDDIELMDGIFPQLSSAITRRKIELLKKELVKIFNFTV